jgi:hypothetical protein
MDTRYELTLIDMIRSSIRNLHWATVSAFAVGAVAFGICGQMTPYYGYTALVESATLGSLATPPQPDGQRFQAEPSSIKKEAINYLTFKYIDPKVPDEATAYLKKVLEVKGSEMLELRTMGLSADLAKSYMLEVVQDLQLKYDSAIQDVLGDATTSIKLFDQKIAAMKASLQSIDKTTAELGFSVILIQQKADIERELLKTEAQNNQSKAAISKEKIHNFYIHDIRPLDDGPSSPKTALCTVVGGMLGFFGYMFLLFLREEDRRLKASYTKGAEPVTSAPAALAALPAPSPAKAPPKAPPRMPPRLIPQSGARSTPGAGSPRPMPGRTALKR